jgi:hypothetical protein
LTFKMAVSTILMEAVSTSETSVSFYQTTRRNNPKDKLDTRRCDSLKPHAYTLVLFGLTPPPQR